MARTLERLADSAWTEVQPNGEVWVNVPVANGVKLEFVAEDEDRVTFWGFEIRDPDASPYSAKHNVCGHGLDAPDLPDCELKKAVLRAATEALSREDSP